MLTNCPVDDNINFTINTLYANIPFSLASVSRGKELSPGWRVTLCRIILIPSSDEGGETKGVPDEDVGKGSPDGVGGADTGAGVGVGVGAGTGTGTGTCNAGEDNEVLGDSLRRFGNEEEELSRGRGGVVDAV